MKIDFRDIVGDNLDALQHLKYSYAEKIKCIYIDPPYNTGKDDFVYNDKFAFSVEELTKKLDVPQEEAERIAGMEGKCTHSAWLTFMYPRLVLARELLREDGVIFISIDDNEQANLKRLCDEVFGEGNFVGELIIQTATDNNPRQISTEHEYMLCYAKTASILQPWTIKSENAEKISKQYQKLCTKNISVEKIQSELRDWIKKNETELKYVEHYNCVDDKGVYTANTNSSNTKPGGYTYDILHPVTHKPCAKPDFGWRWAESTFWTYAKNGDVEWGKDETTQPHIKKRIETAQEQLKTIIYEDGRASTKLLEILFNKKKIFDNPKSYTMLKRIFDFVTSSDSIILDFFSGSGTTAHAVMDLNAKDGGRRKFIMVQLDEPVKKGGEAEKAGYKTIDQIGRERIRRAAAKIKSENPDTGADLGFKTYYLKQMPKETLDKIKTFDPGALILDGGDIVKSLGETTLLQTWQIKDGFGFLRAAKKIDLAGYSAYFLDDEKIGRYLYLLSEMPESAIKELVRKIESMELAVDKIFAYGYSFDYNASLALRTNLKTLKNRNPIEPIVRW